MKFEFTGKTKIVDGKKLQQIVTLDKTWKECLRMWRWIAKMSKTVEYEEVSIDDLKKQWLHKHGYKGKRIINRCFFCDYAGTEDGFFDIKGGVFCSKCPGYLVSRKFHCEQASEKYKWNKNPKAFYNKLRSLNKKRLAKKSKASK